MHRYASLLQKTDRQAPCMEDRIGVAALAPIARTSTGSTSGGVREALPPGPRERESDKSAVCVYE